MLEFTQNSSWGWDIRDSFMQLVRISRSLKHMSGGQGEAFQVGRIWGSVWGCSKGSQRRVEGANVEWGRDCKDPKQSMK